MLPNENNPKQKFSIAPLPKGSKNDKGNREVLNAFQGRKKIKVEGKEN